MKTIVAFANTQGGKLIVGVDDKMRTGKIGYMKTMWKWLTQHEWERYEEQMNLEQQTANSYGTGIL